MPTFRQLSQVLFYQNGTEYNQPLILNSNDEVDLALLAEQGLPYYAGTRVVTLLSSNRQVGDHRDLLKLTYLKFQALAATFTHLLLWRFDDLHSA